MYFVRFLGIEDDDSTHDLSSSVGILTEDPCVVVVVRCLFRPRSPLTRRGQITLEKGVVTVVETLIDNYRHKNLIPS